MKTNRPEARKLKRSEAGLTLIELMMATMVFAVGMVAVLGSIVGIMANHRVAVTKHNANIEIQDQLADMQSDISGANVFAFDIDNNLPDGLPGFPGSLVEVYIVKPDDGVNGVELILLPDTNSANNFPSGAPVPTELVFEARVPTSTASGNGTYYRFRMSALF